MNQDIKKILDLSVYAPSGDNCQPWRFEVSDNQIRVFNLPERDDSLYNWNQQASYIAHGALIENVYIAASHSGYTTQHNVFPDSSNRNYVANVLLKKIDGQKKDEPLFSFIPLRTTNRKPYDKKPLTHRERDALLALSSTEVGYGELLFEEDPRNVEQLAHASSVNEKLVLENKYLHSFLYRHINWSEKEDRANRLGFYIKTFELPPPAEKMFKLVRNWSVLQLLNKIGLSKQVSAQNAKVYATASAIGVITVVSNSPEDFIHIGRLLQRVWLTTTLLGLSLQPMTGILLLMLRIQAGGTSQLPQQHVEQIEEAYETIRSLFGVTNSMPALLFRIGHGDEPSARALRLSPDIKVI